MEEYKDEYLAACIHTKVRELNDLRLTAKASRIAVEYRVTMCQSEGEIGQLKATITKTL